MSEDNENLDNLALLHAVQDVDLVNLLKHFAKNTYNASDPDEFSNKTLEKCIQLMKQDYSVATINNSSGELSAHYPSKIPFFEYEKSYNLNGSGAPTIYESACDCEALLKIIRESRFARCRTRFPVPVILYKGKYICRSSTLSGGPEIYSRTGYSLIFTQAKAEKVPPTPPPIDCSDSLLNPNREWTNVEWALFDKVRGYDIKLLQKLHVGTIVDLMVENKKVKYGMYVSSSEKIDKSHRYNCFQIIGLPYPGCEFFKDFSQNNYSAEALVYDWAQDFVDAPIKVPDDHVSSQLNIEWNDYTTWDLIRITQNYMKLLLKYVQENSTGILIHCISGWDRTPLFISLLRLSLWADGLIHQNLDVNQMLYLTLAYDWFLFGHHLNDRLSKGEDILLFCFHVIKYIEDDEYNISSLWPRNKKQEQTPNEKSNCTAEYDLGIMLDNESRGSNISINSACSSVSNKSQDQLSAVINISDDSNNGNSPPSQSMSIDSCNSKSPQSKRTSPVTVPSARLRQRHDSTTSMGSWQFITSAGSLRSSEKSTQSEVGVSSGRRERLNSIRNAFYKAYPKGVGFEPKHTFYGGLLNTIGNLAGYVYNN